MEKTEKFKNIDDYLDHWNKFFVEWNSDSEGTFDKDVIWSKREGKEWSTNKGIKKSTKLEPDVFPQPYLGDIKNNQQVDLNYLFPKQTEVFASWYSGDIRIPEGELLKKINLGYASIFEKDRILTFKEGLLIGETVKDNITSENLNYN